MKFCISQKEFNQSLGFVSRAVAVRSTDNIHKGILLSVKSGILTLTASDTHFTIEKKLPVTDSEDGSVVLMAGLLTDIIRKLPDGEIFVSLKEEYEDSMIVTIKNDFSRFKMVGMPSDAFPIPEDVTGSTRKIIINKHHFRDMIRKTSFAASLDESRGVIVGVLIELLNGNITLAALDGFRMAVAREESENKEDQEVIIPAKILNDIGNLIGDTEEGGENLELHIDEREAVIRTEDSRIIIQLIQGQFIRYRDILPNDFRTTVTVDRKMLTDSIERASLFAKDGKHRLIKISITDDNIEISSRSEAGTVHENIPVKKNGDDIQIGLNARYILDGLKVIQEEEIVLKLNSNVMPCILEPLQNQNFTYLILPVRIQA